MVIVKFKLKCVLKKLKTISSLSFSTTLHLYFLKLMTIRLSLSQEIKRILAFLRLHKNMQGAVVVAFFSFCFFFFIFLQGFFSPEESRNCPCVFDFAYQLLTRHLPFAPLCQVDE